MLLRGAEALRRGRCLFAFVVCVAGGDEAGREDALPERRRQEGRFSRAELLISLLDGLDRRGGARESLAHLEEARGLIEVASDGLAPIETKGGNEGNAHGGYARGPAEVGGDLHQHGEGRALGRQAAHPDRERWKADRVEIEAIALRQAGAGHAADEIDGGALPSGVVEHDGVENLRGVELPRGRDGDAAEGQRRLLLSLQKDGFPAGVEQRQGHAAAHREIGVVGAHQHVGRDGGDAPLLDAEGRAAEGLLERAGGFAHHGCSRIRANKAPRCQLGCRGARPRFVGKGR